MKKEFKKELHEQIIEIGYKEWLDSVNDAENFARLAWEEVSDKYNLTEADLPDEEYELIVKELDKRIKEKWKMLNQINIIQWGKKDNSK